jgi:hypothetical protein
MNLRLGRSALALLLPLVLASPALAQSRRFREPRVPVGEDFDFSKLNTSYDGRFVFVRVRYNPLPGARPGGYFNNYLKWDHDYPRAETHLMKILSELTSMSPYMDGGNILAVDDPELFKYPVAYMAEPGFWTLTEDEAESLRNYLLKGGFLIFDDFVGRQWWNFEDRIRDVLPDARLVELDVSHPIFHSFFEIDQLEFVHPYWDYRSVFYGVFEDNDPAKRLMIIVNYNNDIGESWEYSDRGFIPIELSNEAYKLGVNYIVYAMTH